jgi:hypothetical protein
MQTDELRRALHELAYEQEPFDASAQRVRGRVRRRRAAIGAALCLLLASPVVAVAVARDRDERLAVAAAKEVSVEDLAQRDALVVVPIDGRPDDVRASLEAAGIVTAYSFVRPGIPSSLLSIPEHFPTEPARCGDAGGFVVDLRDGAAVVPDLAATVGDAVRVLEWADLERPPGEPPGVVDGLLGLGRWQNGVEAEIFMIPHATPEQIAGVRARLESDPDVDMFEYLDQHDAYEEFRRIFVDQPAVVASTDPEALPASFRIRPMPGADVDALEARYAVEGVDEVLRPLDTPCDQP